MNRYETKFEEGGKYLIVKSPLSVVTAKSRGDRFYAEDSVPVWLDSVETISIKGIVGQRVLHKGTKDRVVEFVYRGLYDFDFILEKFGNVGRSVTFVL